MTITATALSHSSSTQTAPGHTADVTALTSVDLDGAERQPALRRGRAGRDVLSTAVETVVCDNLQAGVGEPVLLVIG